MTPILIYKTNTGEHFCSKKLVEAFEIFSGLKCSVSNKFFEFTAYMNIPPEIIGYTAAFLTTVSFLPQVFLTVRTRNTESLSLGMYSLLTLGVVFWMIYGILKEDQVIIIANGVTLLLSITVLSVKIRNRIKGER